MRISPVRSGAPAGEAELLLQAAELVAERSAPPDTEIGQRVVQQQRARAARHCAGQGQP